MSQAAFERKYVYRTKNLRRLRTPREAQCHFLRTAAARFIPPSRRSAACFRTGRSSWTIRKSWHRPPPGVRASAKANWCRSKPRAPWHRKCARPIPHTIRIMKAVGVFPRKQQVKLVEHDEPRISAPGSEDAHARGRRLRHRSRDLRLRIRHAAARIGSFHSRPRISGRSGGNRPGGEPVKPGDLVIATVRRPCPHAECVACRAGRPDFCITGDYHEHGIKDMDGFMTEFVVDAERYLNPCRRNCARWPCWWSL